MELSFGTKVREHGYGIGRLAAVEVDRRTRAVRNIIISADGAVDNTAGKRPLAAVPPNHFEGDILLHSFISDPETLAPGEVLVLSGATRVMRNGQQIGRLMGLELSPESGEIVSICGRQHWWSHRLRLQAAALDFSVPGEIRVITATSQAA